MTISSEERYELSNDDASDREMRAEFWKAWESRGWTRLERGTGENDTKFFTESGEHVPMEVYGACPHWFILDYGIVDLTNAKS